MSQDTHKRRPFDSKRVVRCSINHYQSIANYPKTDRFCLSGRYTEFVEREWESWCHMFRSSSRPVRTLLPRRTRTDFDSNNLLLLFVRKRKSWTPSSVLLCFTRGIRSREKITRLWFWYCEVKFEFSYLYANMWLVPFFPVA